MTLLTGGGTVGSSEVSNLLPCHSSNDSPSMVILSPCFFLTEGSPVPLVQKVPPPSLVKVVLLSSFHFCFLTSNFMPPFVTTTVHAVTTSPPCFTKFSLTLLSVTSVTHIRSLTTLKDFSRTP